jgi:ATP synthase protein I
VAKKNAQKVTDSASAFNHKFNTKLSRKLQAQRKTTQTIWSGLGMMGLIGWSVVVPTLLGAMLGIWLDNHHPNPERSWTLVLLMLGLTLGCFNAWHWVAKEDREIHKKEADDE